jgi:hypothetical protein
MWPVARGGEEEGRGGLVVVASRDGLLWSGDVPEVVGVLFPKGRLGLLRLVGEGERWVVIQPRTLFTNGVNIGGSSPYPYSGSTSSLEGAASMGGVVVGGGVVGVGPAGGAPGSSPSFGGEEDMQG